MPRTHQEILAEIDSFAPPNDDWDKLQSLLDELWTKGTPEDAVPNIIAVFERYAINEDGCGVFWSALHGLETLRGYEPYLLDSVQKSPSEFVVMMLGRILNAKIDMICDTSITTTLNAVAQSQTNAEPIREMASAFLQQR